VRWLWWMWFLFGPIVPSLLLCFELQLMLELRFMLELWLVDRIVLRLPEGRAFLRRSSGRGCTDGTGEHAGSCRPGQGTIRLALLDSMGNNGPGLFERGPAPFFVGASTLIALVSTQPRNQRGVDGRGKSRRKWVAAGETMSVIEQPASAFAEHYFGRRTG
jgi:hypothetical protein